MRKSAVKLVYFNRILALFVLWGWSSALVAQVVSTNNEGRKIIVFSDGSWRYFEGKETAMEPARTLHPDSQEFAKPVTQAREAASVANQTALVLIRARVILAALEWEIDSLENADVKVAESGLHEKRNRLYDLQREIDILDAQHHLAKEWAALLAKTAYYQPSVRREELVSWQQAHGFAGEVVLRPITPQPIPVMANSGSYRFHHAPRPEDDLMLHPPPTPCEVAHAGTDAITGLKRWDTQPSLLFSKTDKALQAAFPESDLIRCHGYLTAVAGGLRILHLVISIATPKAQHLYGSFEKGGMLELRLLSGESVRLFNNRPDSGIWDAALQSTVYHLQFQIGGIEEKLLRQGELDAVWLHWSQVKEEFEIYETDFFLQHFSCLDQRG
ncbi:MAG: hypothetical protein EPO28_09590 [Saprospiraceae bacterium]|nr:MAG: hypothetical protein EPO28_09590 [Saprospiraceae bacterium]